MKLRSLKKVKIYQMLSRASLPSIWRLSEADWVGHNDAGLQNLLNEVLLKKPAEFICKRAKDDVVVASFGERAAALDLMLKHARQKKAKLYVVDENNQPVLFSEEETA